MHSVAAAVLPVPAQPLQWSTLRVEKQLVVVDVPALPSLAFVAAAAAAAVVETAADNSCWTGLKQNATANYKVCRSVEDGGDVWGSECI